MDCRILRQLTLKADGHLSCDDSNGYYIHLGEVAARSGWSVKQIFGGAIYEHIRRSLKAGQPPWPGKCETCDCFSPHDNPVDTLESRLRIMVEPTLECRLSCPSCKRKQELSRRQNRNELSPALLDALIASCVRSGIIVDEVHYLGWGEPLLHTKFQDLLSSVRKYSTETVQEVTTTGNVDFRSSIGQSYVDRIIVSCDGVRQTEYERYRINGRLQETLKFMRDAKSFGRPDIFVQWKYILFDGNDDPADLVEAQAMADDFGVDSLLFVITNSKGRSLRFTSETIDEVPIRSTRAKVSPAAAMMIGSKRSSHIDQARSVLGDRENATLYVDQCRITKGNILAVTGWSLASDGSYVDTVEMACGRRRQVTPTDDIRRDVLAARSNACGPLCGFLFRLPLGDDLPPDRIGFTVKYRNHIEDFSAALKWS